MACLQGVADDFLHVGWQNLTWAILANRAAELKGSLVAIGDGAVASEFHSWIGIQQNESSHPPQFGFSMNPLHRHRQHRRKGEQEMDLVLREPAPARCVRPQGAEGLPMSSNSDVDSTHDAMFGQQ